MRRNKWKAIRKQIWRDIYVLAIVTVLLIVGGYVVIQARTWSVLGPLPTRIDTTEKVVALTFDDGPTQPQTSKLLTVLSDEQIKATFYLIGVEMVRHPAAADAIINAGQEVGNHGYTHTSLMFMDPGTLDSEITTTDTLLRQHGYTGDITIRPPYGHKLFELPIYAAQHHRQLVMWDFPLGTESHPTVESIVADGAKQVRPGSIIIMHVMYDHNTTTLDAVKPLIQKLKADGYRFVTVSELLKLKR